MGSLTEPQVVLTHESDLDGLVSGLLLQRLAKHVFGSDTPLEAYHYQGWKLRSLSERTAWVSDFSFETRLDKPNWLIVDHHSGEIVPKLAKLIHDPLKSASRLCYEMCQQHALATPELDRIVHLTDVGDLYTESDPDFIEACDYGNLVKAYGFWNLHTLIEGDITQLLNHPLLEVMRVKRRVEDPIGLECARHRIEALSPEVGLVKTIIGNTNAIVHRLLEQGLTTHTVLVTLFKKGNNAFVVSFRSRNGEALKLASKLDGGGHPNAAGTTLPKSVNNHELATEYIRQRINPRAEPSGLTGMEDLLARWETARK